MSLHSLYNDTMGPFISYIPRMTVFKMVIGQSYTVQDKSEQLNYKLSKIWEVIPESDKKTILLDNNVDVFNQHISDSDLQDDLKYALKTESHIKLIKVAFLSWLFTELSNKNVNQPLNYYHTGLLDCFWDNERSTTVKNEFIYNFIKNGVNLTELKKIPLNDFRNPELLYNILEDNEIPSDIFSWILDINDMNISWHDCSFEKDKAERIIERKKNTHYIIDVYPIRMMTDYGHSLKNYLDSPYTFEKIINNSPKKSEILSSCFYEEYCNNYASSFRELGKKILASRNSRKASLLFSVFEHFDFSNINETRRSFFMRACLEFNKLYLLKAGNEAGNDIFKHTCENLQEQMLTEFTRERQIAYSGEDMLILLNEMNVTQINNPELLKKTLRVIISNNDIKSLAYVHKNILADTTISEFFNYYLNVQKNVYTSTLPNCSQTMMYFYKLMSYKDKFNILEMNQYHYMSEINDNNIDLHFMFFIMQKRDNLEFLSFLDVISEKQKSSFTEEGLAKMKLTVIDRVARSNNTRNIKPLNLVKQIGITYNSTDIAYVAKYHRVNNYIMNFLCAEPVDENTSSYKQVINEYINNAHGYQYNSCDFRAVFVCIDLRYEEKDIEEAFLLAKENIIKLKEKGSWPSGVNSLEFYHKIFQRYAKIYNLELPVIPEKIINMDTINFLITDIKAISIAQEKAVINSLISEAPALKNRRI